MSLVWFAFPFMPLGVHWLLHPQTCFSFIWGNFSFFFSLLCILSVFPSEGPIGNMLELLELFLMSLNFGEILAFCAILCSFLVESSTGSHSH